MTPQTKSGHMTTGISHTLGGNDNTANEDTTHKKSSFIVQKYRKINVAKVLAPVKRLTRTMNFRNSLEPQIGSRVFPMKRTAKTLTIACKQGNDHLSFAKRLTT